MENKELTTTISKLFEAIEKLIPVYMANPDDQCIFQWKFGCLRYR